MARGETAGMDDWPAAVVFDLDGTLVDTMPLILPAYADAVREVSGSDVTTDEVLAGFHVGPTPVLLTHLLGRPVTPEEVERFFAHYENAVAGVEPRPGVVDLLDALGTSGRRLAVFTSATRRAAAHVLRATGLARRFAVVVAGDEVARPKPAPDGLLDACARLGVAPAAAAYVGDADVDRACAEAAGCRFLDIEDALSRARRRGARGRRRG